MAKPLLNKLFLDDMNLKIVNENRQKIGSFTLFKNTFIGQFFNHMKANWMFLLFCVPVVALIIYFMTKQSNIETYTPFSANLGIGYPVVNYSQEMSAAAFFDLAMLRSLAMLPIIMIAFVGFAGLFNVVKYYVWGMNIKLFKTFFRGIKNSWFPFVWTGAVYGLCFILLSFVFNVFKVYTDVALWLQIIIYIFTIVFCLFVVGVSLFTMTQASAFSLPLSHILLNSIRLLIYFPLQNILILIASLVTMVLPFFTFNPLVQLIAYALFFMMAFSYLCNVWTIYSQYVFGMIYDVKLKSEKSNNRNISPAKSSSSLKSVSSQAKKTNQIQASSDTKSFAENKPVSNKAASSEQTKKTTQAYSNPKKGKKKH
jgi:hypothetical protein